MGKSETSQSGGTNCQCLPHDPDYINYVDGQQNNGGLMYGTEYYGNADSLFEMTNLDDSTFIENNVPCAVCHIDNRTSVMMIPAKNTCPPDWTEEYWGYLVSAHYNSAGMYITYIFISYITSLVWSMFIGVHVCQE